MKTRLSVLFTLAIVVLLGVDSAGAQSSAFPSKAEREKLNTFFSNFSEAFVPDFDQGTLNDELLIRFGIRHCYINQFAKMRKSADRLHLLIPKDAVDRAAMKYFGRKPGRHTCSGANYSEPLADGEAYTFSQLTKLQALGGDAFAAEVVIYASAAGELVDPHGTPAAWRAQGARVYLTNTATAVIRKLRGDDGSVRYILLEYHLAPG